MLTNLSNKDQEFNDFKSCVEAVGSYWNLLSMLRFLSIHDYHLDYDEDRFDEAYDTLQREEFYDVLDMFFTLELDVNDQEAIDEFLKDVDFTDVNFKRKCIKFIIKEILPNHEEWRSDNDEEV